MSHTRSVRAATLMLALSCLMGGVSVRAATITVFTSADEAADGQCALREAVQAINTGANYLDCANGSLDPYGTNDTIQLQAGTTFTLTGTGEDGASKGDLDILKSVRILGSAGTVVNADGVDRAFDIFAADVAFRGFPIIKGAPEPGAYGGLVRVNGGASLLLVSMLLDSGSATAGGAIDVATWGVLTATDSSIQGSAATDLGGGIYIEAKGRVDLQSTRVQTNTAGPGPGGGVYNDGGVLTANGGALRNNAAFSGGGLYNNTDGKADLTAMTIITNTADKFGGGIFNAALAEVQLHPGGLGLPLVLNNAADSGGGVYNSAGGTLISQAADFFGNTAVDGAGVWNGGTATHVNDYAFENTATAGGGGMYVDAGGVATLLSDSRIFDNRATFGGGVRNFGVFAMTSGLIQGNWADNGGGMFTLSGSRTTLASSRVQFNRATGLPAVNGIGGGILNGGALTLTNQTVVFSNTAVFRGGGLYNTAGTALLVGQNITFSTNLADYGGGLFAGVGSRARITAALFLSNTALSQGGGAWSDGRLDLSASRLERNVALDGGLGLYTNVSGTSVLTTVTFARNHGGVGLATGALLNRGVTTGTAVSVLENTASYCTGVNNYGVLALSAPQIAGNAAALNGGGACSSGGRFYIAGGGIVSNTAADGAGLFTFNTRAALSGTLVAENLATTPNALSNHVGGGIWHQIGGSLILMGARVERNVANLGGGIELDSGAALTLTSGTVISANRAYTDGGGIYGVGFATLLADAGGVIVHNDAGRNGGGLFAASSSAVTASVRLSATSISTNTAAGNGGGAVISGNLRLDGDSLLLRDNTAANGGGMWIDSFFDVFASADITPVVTVTDSQFIENDADPFFGRGGALSNGGILRGLDLLIAGNTAYDGGGVHNHRALILTRTEILKNEAVNWGGAALNAQDAAMDISSGTIAANAASVGAGFSNRGQLALLDSAVIGNDASNTGGGFLNGRDLALKNVTLSGNSALSGSAIFNSSGIAGLGAVTLTHVTVHANTAAPGGAAVWSIAGSTVWLRSTIVGSNPGGNCSTAYAPPGTITSLGYNIDGENSCGLGAAGDMIFTNPLLGPLVVNPPGSTFTHALLPGSPAINSAANAGCPATDQRGVPRPLGPACDRGAYESAWFPRALLPSTQREAGAAW